MKLLLLSYLFAFSHVTSEVRQNSIEFVEERRIQIQRRDKLDPNEFLGIVDSQNTQRDVIAYFSPSPAADAVPITEQNQVATSFAPQFTVCILPPVAFVPVNETTGLNGTASDSNEIEESPEPTVFVASVPDANETCSTFFRPSSTTICATILTGLATRVTVTDCEQEVTFSSQWGFELETPAPVAADLANRSTAFGFASPTVQTLMTYYRAPWQSLTAGYVPRNVEATVCRMADDGSHSECVEVRELWSVVPVIMTSTITSEVDFTTVVTGPAKVRVETVEIDVTRTISEISLSTTLTLEYEFESERTEVEFSPESTVTSGSLPVATDMFMTTVTTKDEFESEDEITSSGDETRTSTITRTHTATLTVENASSR